MRITPKKGMDESLSSTFTTATAPQLPLWETILKQQLASAQSKGTDMDAVHDRIRGAMIGAAAGDALGAGYELGRHCLMTSIGDNRWWQLRLGTRGMDRRHFNGDPDPLGAGSRQTVGG